MSKNDFSQLSLRGEEYTLERLQSLAKNLPGSLKSVARFMLTALIGWEWKHFWTENAVLYSAQNQLTRKIKKRDHWSPTEDAVFEGWNKSEYAQAFMEKMGKSNSLKASSEYCLKLLERQLQAFAQKHAGMPGKKIYYLEQFELGDFPTPSVSSHIQVSDEGFVEFLSWDRTALPKHLKRIQTALELIKTYSPVSYQRFCAFTKRIVPIKQKEMVSYSLQTLPGHSFINLYHRDEIDLLDDLLHENGHHHLNLYLILGNLLREDPDQIYYSPWRRTLRPVRGIYHAHYTFYFALELFHDLACALLEERLEWPTELTKTKKQKIFYRFMEEWHMLNFTGVDLIRARRRGQITLAGQKVIQTIEKRRKLMLPMVKKVAAKLDADSRESLEALLLILNTQKKLTRADR